MFPSSNEPGGGPLEARLRNMIINNANADQGASQTADSAQLSRSNSQAPPHMMAANPNVQVSQEGMPKLPPHMQSATPMEQQEYLTNAKSRAQESANSNGQTSQRRKRPNQAQRMQMSSQLSIPIDSRPAQAAHSGRGHSPRGGQDQGQWGGHGSPQHQNQNNRYSPNQQYSPRYPQNGPPTPYSPQTSFPQHSPRSPMHQYQSGPHPQMPQRQGPYQSQQYQQGPYSQRPPRQLYQPGPYQSQGRGTSFGNTSQDISIQGAHLETLLQESVSVVVIDPQEAADNEAFRALVEQACRETIVEYEQIELGNKQFDASSVELQCFGSMMSGFATKASDMDLAILSPKSVPAPDSTDSPIPRLLEKTLLKLGFGARLLTRTRVPIIKLCQKPTEKLRMDLLEERAKWESGFTAEMEEEEANDVDASGKDQGNEMIDDVSSAPAKAPSSKSNERSYEDKLATLKQKEHLSLADYLGHAKRLMRKLGGRDITSTSPDLNDNESKILNDICKAFVSGLFSSQLALRLKGYQTIAPLFDSTLQPIQRTLHGISIQVEGERLAMAWENRPLTEPDERAEMQGLAEVEAWRVLQDKEGAIVESINYDRLLYAAAERLKRISSLQLVFLEQIPHEEPISYYTRAQKLLDFFKRRESSGSTDTVSPIVLERYIAGVAKQSFREFLQASTHKDANLQRVAMQHRILQLGVDYEHALFINLYDETDRPHVEEYISYLKSLNITDPETSLKAQETSAESALIAKIRTLPDPTTVSPNKPRDRYKDHLEFPNTDIGIQCDINFSAHLAIHNTLLLRCYSHCDPRVKMMILFVKHWAKVRGINTPYRGSLSSYGYVLMVLHYLVNVAQPFVCPNLQAVNKDPPPYLPPAEIEARSVCNGCDVRFWRNEAEIKNLAEKKMLNHNHDSVGMLLRGFFEYYAQAGPMTTVQNRGFDWGREVLSLRTQGGILTKQEKGWVGAKTVYETSAVAPPTPSPSTAKHPITPKTESTTPENSDAKPAKPQPKVEETKEIRHRYLFAIEDPFELDHNVARTVTHNGIVSIRDEFRRAWRIIRAVGKPDQRDGGLLDALDTTGSSTNGGWDELLRLIHGPEPKGEIGMDKIVGAEG
ncbi:Terminal uridylyltransferase cid1 [Lachnellula suecica]|uniref:polynucleotide adenylyltransferase n=1 Tax=Lachnellula suecica TaxID=602035 RepID=A0A8T9CE23_9HELO|nr:Terminal uridylyltransferase cid1 [Lachnellula suecica]